MNLSCLRVALLAVAFGLGSTSPLTALQASAQAVVRPEISTLTLALEDGRSYALTGSELQEATGGALFWGDWAVTHLLVPRYVFFRDPNVSPYAVIREWWTPGRSGELPAFLILTAKGPVYPLETSGPDRRARPFQPAPRPRITSLVVGYADGRTISLSELTLRDEKSGILVWNDFAVQTLLVPFYAAGKSSITTASDVVRTWNTPTTAISSGTSRLMLEDELPGFLVKPRCIPAYPGPD